MCVRYIGVLILLIAPLSLSASLNDNYGFGGAKTGTAGAGMALVNDWASPMYNISGLAAPPLLPQAKSGSRKKVDTSLFSDSSGDTEPGLSSVGIKSGSKRVPQSDRLIGNRVGSQIGFGLMHQASRVQVSRTSSATNDIIEDMNSAMEGLDSTAINLGVVFDIRNVVKTPLNMPVRFGLAIATNANGDIARINDIDQDAYNFKRMGREVQKMTLVTGTAWQVWPNRLSLGFGFSSATVTEGKLRVADAQLAITEGQSPKTQAQIDAGTNSAVIAGLTYRHPILRRMSGSFGFQYKAESFLKNDIKAETLLELGPLGATSNANQLMIAYYSPHTFTSGLGFVFERYQVGLDFELQMWSNFFLSKLRQEYEQDPGFKDIVIVRFGGEGPLPIPALQKLPLIFRAGYGYTPAITPDQSGRSNYLDNDKHIIALGAGYTIGANKIVRGTTILDLGMQFQLLPERKANKQASIASAEQPNYKYGGGLFIVNLSATFVMGE